jgi:hypothetical protein
MDEVVTTTAEAPAAAVEQAPANGLESIAAEGSQKAPVDQEWADLIDAIKGEGTAAKTEAAKKAEPPKPAEPEKPAKKKLPPREARIESARDRIIAERTKAPVEDHAKQLHSQLQQERQYREQYFAKQRELMEAGDYDGLLQMATGLSLKDVQQRVLEKRGALPPPDPRLDALQQRIQAYEQAEQQRRQQAEEQHRTKQQQAAYKQHVDAMKRQLKASDYESFDEKAEAYGFAEKCVELLASNPHLPDEEVYRQVDELYAPIAESLLKAYYPQLWAIHSGGQSSGPATTQQAGGSRDLQTGAPRQVATPNQAGSNRPESTVLRQGNSADAGARRYENDDEEWQALKRAMLPAHAH